MVSQASQVGPIEQQQALETKKRRTGGSEK